MKKSQRSQAKPISFPRGAKWVRADFHLHTRSDKEFQFSYTAPQEENNEDEEFQKSATFVKDYVNRLKQEKISIGAITNHNKFYFEEFKELKRACKKNTLLLPGVELSTNEGANGVHTLIIFGDEWLEDNEDRISPFIASMFLGKSEREYQQENGRSDKSLLDVVDTLVKHQLPYFIIFAHVEQKSGLWKELGGGKLGDLTGERYAQLRKRVLGFQKVRTHDAVKAGRKGEFGRVQIKQKLRDWYPAEVEGSDCKSIDEIGKGQKTFLKLGELSYNAVEFALRDHQKRVCHKLPEPSTTACIQHVSFKGGLLDGRGFELNRELNCLIGSRGSGKSSMIECLRYGLGIPSAEDEIYKERLVNTMLGNGGKLTIHGVSSDQQNFQITRIHGNEPLVSLEGRETRLRPKDVLKGVLYFGQKDLGVRHEEFEKSFFQNLVSETAPENRDQEDRLLRQIREKVENLNSASHAAEKTKEYQQELEVLKHRLDTYKEKGVELKLERLTCFDSDREAILEFGKKFNELKRTFGEMECGVEDTIAGLPELKTQELATSSTKLKKIKDLLEGVTLDMGGLREKAQLIEKTLGEAKTLMLEKEKELQEGFASLQREIDEPGLNIAEFRRVKQRHEQFLKLLALTKNGGDGVKEEHSQLLSLAQTLQDLRRKEFVRKNKELALHQQNLPEELSLHMKYQGDKADFVTNFLKKQLAGKWFHESTYEILAREYESPFQIYEGDPLKIKELLTPRDAEKLINVMEEKKADFLTYQVADLQEIHYEGSSIKQLSLGQRAMALLQLLMSLREQSILIIDQPEDDLDNETVYNQVVKPLLANKSHVQFIIASHNPNIPVLGDAEQVHACYEESKGQYLHKSGSLDSRVTRDSIVKIMEGGEDAFKRRKEIYSQWTNLN